MRISSSEFSLIAGPALLYRTGPLELVRAVRAERDVVLEIDRVVDGVLDRIVVAELQAEEAELAVAPGRFDAVPLGIVAGRERQRRARRPELVEAIADVPRATEAIDRFEVRATPIAGPRQGQRIGGIGEDLVRLRVHAVALVEEKLAAGGEAAVLCVAVRRPFSGAVGQIERIVSAEAVVGERRLRFQHRDAGEPRVLVADVAARVREQRPGADAVVIRAAARIVLAAERFAAELEVRIGRRKPAQLRA